MPTKSVLIVGGGSAGWIAAAYLDAALNAGGQRAVDITVVESPNIPRISVGEATIPSIQHLLGVIGVDEKEFMKATDATFKQSIRYVNWLHKEGHAYHHPFSRYRIGPIDRSGVKWLGSDRKIPFMEAVSAQVQISDMGLAPLMLGKWDFGPPLSYAYHMNAHKFADYLCALSKSRGVTHILDDVVDVEMKDDGGIAAVKTQGGKRLAADIFVDCTGFAAILIEKKLGVGFVDCSQWLLCDRAVTMHVPYDHFYPGHVRPFTTATALSAGWVWDIPLSKLRSVGYVHSSQFVSDDQAEAELRAYEGAHCADLPSRVVKFVVGRRQKAWVKNCVAIGLSGGFIEPLESTGLYLSDLAVVMLAEHFPFGDDMEPLAFRYNRILSNRFYEILDFINMHYVLTRRTDTEFWREVQRQERIVDRLQAKLDFWKIKPPSPTDFEDQLFPGQSMDVGHSPGSGADQRPPVDTAGLWNHESYECIMYGMDFMGDEYREKFGDDRPPVVVPDTILQRVHSAKFKLPPHDTWLQQNLGMQQYPGGRNQGWITGPSPGSGP